LEDSAYGVGKPGLNLQNIKDVEIALPPLSEQKEIVRQVDALFAVADSMEARYHKAKASVDKLSHAVLAKAFRGELAAQNPADEPAEKLLERIIAEKGNIEKKKQVQKSRLPKHLT
jgi:type I restriction enzyme S subunit